MRLQETILKTIGLGKSFKGFSAVTDVNLDVTRGTIHALIGPNGAGKTTILRALQHFPKLLDNNIQQTLEQNFSPFFNKTKIKEDSMNYRLLELVDSEVRLVLQSLSGKYP